jgi:hypothetical protein
MDREATNRGTLLNKLTWCGIAGVVAMLVFWMTGIVAFNVGFCVLPGLLPIAYLFYLIGSAWLSK